MDNTLNFRQRYDGQKFAQMLMPYDGTMIPEAVLGYAMHVMFTSEDLKDMVRRVSRFPNREMRMKLEPDLLSAAMKNYHYGDKLITEALREAFAHH